MSSVILNGDTSGSVTLTVPNAAGTNTVTVAAQTGTLNAAGPAFSATSAGSQTLTSNTWTKFALTVENFDTNSNFDSTTNYRFTPTVAGYYQLTAAAFSTASTAMTSTSAAIYKNGAVWSQINSAPHNSTTGNSILVDVVYLNGTTDYVELWGRAIGTGTLTVSSNSFFSGCLIRGA